MCSDKYDTKVEKITEESLREAKKYIMNNELVAFPTETVYGLGAIATSDDAVKGIYEAKGRPSDNPLIVHVHKDYDINKLVEIEHDYVYKLQKAFLPGPLTMVYKSRGVVSNVVSCGLESLAIRIPSNPDAQKFLKYVDVPIAAPSANISKHTSPVTAMHVYNDLKGRLPLILDGGKCTGGIESTVLDVEYDVPVILRSGLITAGMIKSITGDVKYSDNKPTDKVKAPGMKYRHYCPKCETALFERNEIEKAEALYNEYVNSGKKPYYMCDKEIADKLSGNILYLGATSEEIASNLYYKLLEGETKADIIIAFVVDTHNEIDVGVMNRMGKACKKRD